MEPCVQCQRRHFYLERKHACARCLESFYIVIEGELKERWTKGTVVETECGAIYGCHVDDGRWESVFLGNTHEQALNRCNHVLSFL